MKGESGVNKNKRQNTQRGWTSTQRQKVRCCIWQRKVNNNNNKIQVDQYVGLKLKTY